jgi:RHS repeat-associated protein
MFKRNGKPLRSVAICLTVFFFLDMMSIPVQAAGAYVREQLAMDQVLNTDLSEYTGSENSFEPAQETETTDQTIEIGSRYDQDYQTERFIIKYRDETTVSTIHRMDTAMKQMDAVISVEDTQMESISVLTTAHTLTADDLGQTFGKEAIREIEYIQPDYEMSFYSLESEQILDPSNPQLGETSSGNAAVVALLDTGVDTNHPALSGKLVPGYDFVNSDATVNDPDWYHDQGHGTSLAGVIAQVAMVMPLKVFEGGKAYTSDIIAAISYAEEHGAQIANLSFGSRYENRALREAMEGSSLLFVCAAGNQLANIDMYAIYPATFDLPNVLAVSSVDSGDKLARFSNYGAQTVDVAALGKDVETPWLDDTTIKTSGTSISAAVVSGAAAQILRKRGPVDAQSLKARIVSSADTITGLSDKIIGGKRLNLAYALSETDDPNLEVIDIPDTDPLPEVNLDGIPEEDYEGYGADGLMTFRTDMPTAREGLGVVSIGKKIYAIGGQFNSTYYNKMEIYDTETDMWTTGANMTYGVSYFACVAVGTDIYCIGGYNGSYRNYVQVYNTATNTWTTKRALPYSAMGLTAVEYNGSIFVAGGYNGGYLNSVYQYNIAGNTWTVRASLLTARAYHSVVVYNGNMYLEGGTNSSQDWYITTEETYNLSTYLSQQTGLSCVYGMNAALVVDDTRFIVIGGSTRINYGYSNYIIQRNLGNDHSRFQYIRENTMSVARASLGAAVVDGVIYIMGGKNQSYIFNTVEAMEGGFGIGHTMPKKLSSFEAAELDGNIYIVGGKEKIDGLSYWTKDVYAYNIQTETWTQKASLPAYYKAFALVSAYGKLYLISGYKNTSSYDYGAISTQVLSYDPLTDTWKDCFAPIPRTTSNAAVLNGIIYAVCNNGAAYAFDPLKNKWSSIQPFSQSSIEINCVQPLGDYIYALGHESETKVFQYSPATDTWTASLTTVFSTMVPVYQDFYKMDMGVGIIYVYRYNPEENTQSLYKTSALEYEYIWKMCVRNNKIYMFAGDYTGAQTLVEYMPTIDPWIEKLYPPFLYEGMGAGRIEDKLYFAGGYGEIKVSSGFKYQKSLFEYSITNDKWTQRADMSIERAKIGSAVLDNKLYVIGGIAKVGDDTHPNAYLSTTNLVETYDPQTDTWVTKRNFPYDAHSMAAVALNQKIYTFGGKGGDVYSDVYEYNPSTDQWSYKTVLQTARYGAGAVALNGKIYVIGGFNSAGAALTSVEVYDPSTNTWDRSKAPLPMGRGYSGVVADNGIYVIGGSDGYTPVNTVYQYNPTDNRWYQWPGLGVAVEGAAVLMGNGGIHVVDGRSAGDMFFPNNLFASTNSISSYSELVHMGSDQINPSGNLSRTYSDLSYTAPGFTVNVSRTYNSRDTRKSLISPGWSFAFQGKLDLMGNDTVVRMPTGSAATFQMKMDGTYQAKDSRSTLTKIGSEHVLMTKDHYSYGFNANGYLYWMKDSNGNRLDLAVDSTGKVTQVTDQVGRVTTITYTSDRISKITDPAGRTVSYFYDANSRLAQVQGPDSSNFYYTYDTNGLLKEVKNHNSQVLESFIYELPQGEQQHKIKKVKTPYGGTETYTYDIQKGTITMVFGDQTTITYYDKALYPISVVDAEGRESRTEYNLDNGINRYGEIRAYTDRNGNTTFYERDGNGNITRTIYPDRSSKSSTYDQYSNLTGEVDERGNKAYYYYDTNHNLTKKVRPLDGTMAYSTSSNQSLFSIESYTYYTKTAGSRQIYGLLQTETTAAGNALSYTHDANGYPLTTTDSMGHVTSHSYNIIGWPKSETTPKGYVTTYYYDMAGRLLKQVAHGGETTRNIYDALGNLQRTILPVQYAGATDTATFSNQNIVSSNTVHSSLNNLGHRYGYNLAGQVSSKTDPLGNTTDYQYNQFGDLYQETLPNGLESNISYDRLGRVVAKGFLKKYNTILLEEYAYNVLSNGHTQIKTTVYFSETEAAVTLREYDYAERLVKQTNPDGGVSTNRYENGLLTSSSDAMGNVTNYKYNPMGQLSELWSPHSGSNYSLTCYTYDRAGRKTKEEAYLEPIATTASGKKTTTVYTYNLDGTLKDTTTNDSAITSYTYDADGNITNESTLQSTGRSSKKSYVYNHLKLITSSTEYEESKDVSGQADNTSLLPLITNYTYDKNGNLKTITYPGGQAITYTYDLMDRQTIKSRTIRNENNTLQVCNETTVYDSVGNILSSTNEKGQRTEYDYTDRGFLLNKRDAMGGTFYWEYDLQGNVTKQISPQNFTSDTQETNYTSFKYDGMGRRLQTTEVYTPLGSSTRRSIIVETNSYDKNGNLLTTKDALENTTSYSYDKANRQIKQTDPEGNVSTTSYDAMGHIISETNARNVTTVSTYDLYGNLTAKAVAGITVQSATYDLAGHQLTSKDANNNVTAYEYTLSGRVRSTAYPGGYSVRNWYDTMGNNVRSLDSLNAEILSTYDTWGQLLSVKEQRLGGNEAIIRSTRYDVLGNPVYKTDERGFLTQYTYNALSQVTAVKDPLGQTTTYSYDKNGNKTAETNWLGNTTTWQYDSLNRLVTVVDPNNVTIEKLEYTDNHLQSKSTDANGNVTTFSYDRNGRLLSTKDGEGYTVKQTYDPVGNTATKTDGNGRATVYTYDNLNRLAEVTDAAGNTVHYTYDNVGNLLTQTDGNGNIITTSYNAQNLPITRTDPLGRKENYAYTPNGHVSSRTDRNGNVTTYTYDIHGRTSSEKVGGQLISYTYDNGGNLIKVEEPRGISTWTYDALGRATNKTEPQTGTITFAYDLISGMSAGYHGESVTVDGRVTVNVFDKVGRLYQVKDGADITTYTYYPNGNLQTETLPNGITANYTYFNNNKLKTLQNKNGGTILEAYQYAYDGAGNLTAKVDVKGTTVYTYTVLSQLSTVTEPSGKVTSYTYDNAGNRSSETVTENGASITTTYMIDIANRLTATMEERSDETVINRYYYDPAGNVLSRMPESYTSITEGGGSISAPTNMEKSPLQTVNMESSEQNRANPGVQLVPDNYAASSASGGTPSLYMSQDVPGLYTYNAKNQLVKAETRENGVDKTVENTFNYQGYRMSKTSRAKTTYYTYVGDKVIKELDSTGGLVYNVYGLSRISRTLNGEKAYYLYNGHGDVTALVSANKTILARYYYDAFGNILEGDINFPNPYLYAGYTYDQESGLYDLKARFYDAKIARFMQEDTYLGNSTDPLSLNLYTYCSNNPLVYTDPTGHWQQGDEKLSTKDQVAILNATIAYNAAYAKGDKAGMDAAHAAAQAIRNKPSSTTSGNTSSGSGSKDSGSVLSKDKIASGQSTTVLVQNSNGTYRSESAVFYDGKTYLTNGQRIPVGTITFTSGGTYVMTESGGQLLLSASITNGGKTQQGFVINNKTYLQDGSRPTNGANVTIGQDTYLMVEGKGVKQETEITYTGGKAIGNSGATYATAQPTLYTDSAIIHNMIMYAFAQKYPNMMTSGTPKYTRLNDAWCAHFAVWAANKAGVKMTGLNSNSTNELMRQYASQGRLMDPNEYIPKAGDTIFFDWDIKDKDNLGRTEARGGHTGIVVAYKDGIVYTIEGNTSNSINLFTQEVNWSNDYRTTFQAYNSDGSKMFDANGKKVYQPTPARVVGYGMNGGTSAGEEYIYLFNNATPR